MGKRKKSVFDYRGEDSLEFEPDAALTPTEAAPGSIEKVNELAARLECGESLWHPQDKTCHPKDKTKWIEFVGAGGLPGANDEKVGESDDAEEDENNEFSEAPRP